MEKLEFKNYDLTINLKPFINIIGKGASGKTYLLKNLINKINNNNIYLDDKPINSYDINFLKKNVAAVLQTNSFKTDYVKEELLFYQKEVNIEDHEAYENIDRFVRFFNLDEIIESKIEYLTEYEKAFIKILSLLIINPSIIGIDDLLTYLKVDEKIKVIKYAKENNICILNVTSNPEELLFGSDIIIMDNLHVVLFDKTENVLSNHDILRKIGLNEPFIVELSNNLNYYDVVKEKHFNMSTLVGEIWK